MIVNPGWLIYVSVFTMVVGIIGFSLKIADKRSEEGL
jgi:general stress protein CsbA